MATFRKFVEDSSPPWLTDDVGGTILHAFGSVLDAMAARGKEGVKLRFPTISTPTSLGYIGDDKDIERGPLQTDLSYSEQLHFAVDTWKHAGSPFSILPQLRYYFYPNTVPDMRTVTNYYGTWHILNTGTGEVTKFPLEDNWNWLPDTSIVWWWGHVIIDGTVYWILDYWNLGGDWGDGGVWGSNMTQTDADSLNRIVSKWKPKNVRAQIVIIFNTALFTKDNSLAANVDGTGEDPTWRAPLLANFFRPLVNP